MITIRVGCLDDSEEDGATARTMTIRVHVLAGLTPTCHLALLKARAFRVAWSARASDFKFRFVLADLPGLLVAWSAGPCDVATYRGSQ